jgi:phosphoribosylaminoimidazole-succinocarboxamide synthase
MNALRRTDLNLPGGTGVYHGKVRDVYTINEDLLVMVASDRISAFDVILPKGIPFKGQVLNQIAVHMLDATQHLVPNWKISSPHPNITIGYRCDPIRLEMVVRGYLSGHAWRTYRSGQRELCGVIMPDGLRESDPFPEPIITPATKAEEGHDEDISRAEILERGIVSEAVYSQLEKYALALFAEGSRIALSRGLILVDTKYEFGMRNGEVMLMDEIHTPDSSRYFYLEGYDERQARGEEQKQLSKEFVRQWLINNGFQGKEGDVMPQMDDAFVRSVTDRYVELYERLIGKPFEGASTENLEQIAIEAIQAITA